MNKEVLQLLPISVLVLSTLLTGCGAPAETPPAEPASDLAEPASEGDVELGEIESWLDVYYPEAAQEGYTLLLYRRRHPTLIDMNGRVVRAWPQVRAAGRARLLEDGSVMVIAEDGAVRRFDWDGRPVWEFRLAGDDFPHHDLIQLASGSVLVLAHDVEKRLDYLVEVGAGGEVVWRWDAAEHLAAELPRAGDIVNRTHINSLHELVDNHWWAGGDSRFRPGNILISARNLNALYILDKASGEVVWSYYGQLDHQHEALMIPPGRPGAGNLLVFNNGLRDLHEYRKSSILEIDPVRGEVVWRYESPSFFSSTGGTQQSLANGNVLITSSRGGRIFEITRDRKIVWQLTPSYKPMRVERYPYDHSPQLAARERPAVSRVERRNPRRHVDEDLYTFALPHQTRVVQVGEEEERALKEPTICRRLLLPERPELILGFGARERQRQPDREVEVELQATVRPDGEERGRVVFAGTRTFRLDEPEPDEADRRERVGLEEYGLQPVELCLAASGPGGRPAPPVFYWNPPTIRSSNRRVAQDAEKVDERVREVQEKHLKALGYID